jgi:AcrR family transcriptional regulator
VKKKETILEKYKVFELTNGRAPHSVFEFCQANKANEGDFYQHFSSLTQLKRAILENMMQETIAVLDNDEAYAEYSAREKALALFYTLIEVLKGNRSYLQYKYQDLHQVKSNYKDWEDFFRLFDARMEGIMLEAKQNEEVIERPLIGKYYGSSFKLTFTYVFRVWLNDDSKNFERTDAAIEKSVNLAFELFSQGPLDSILDFGRFAVKTKIS